MPQIAPHKGIFRVLIRPGGEVIVPDLVAPLLPVIRSLESATPSFTEARIPCAVETSGLCAARQPACDIAVHKLYSLPTQSLWELHDSTATPARQMHYSSGASLLDLKIEIASRLLKPCQICEHRCGVDRLSAGTGICGLGESVALSGYSMLYNEGPFIGQPTFGVYVKGCSLCCTFCYRPDDLKARQAPTAPPSLVASILDAAADSGAESWHFLGGNPDESLAGILQALRMTQSTRPIVWNSALYLTPEALKLLRGVVDIWVPDLKFGTDQCASELAGISRYSSVVQRNLLALADERFLVVRHMSYPGHEHCCADFVAEWVRENLPNAAMQPLRFVPVHRRRSGLSSIALGR